MCIYIYVYVYVYLDMWVMNGYKPFTNWDARPSGYFMGYQWG